MWVTYLSSMCLSFLFTFVLWKYAIAAPTVNVRLVDGADEYEGRVEILHEGRWGTVCDDSWDLKDAAVVCKQLGFDGALAAPRQAHFGRGFGDIFLDEVHCNGTETNLKDCKHKGIRVNDCGHKEDASVICLPANNSGLSVYPSSAASDVTAILTTLSMLSTEDLTSAADYTTDVSLGHAGAENTSIKQMTTIKTEMQNSTRPSLLLDFLLIGIYLLLISLILILTRLRIARKRRDATDLGKGIYVDVRNTGSKQSFSEGLDYQDLNAPPKLPDRRKQYVLHHDYESSIAHCDVKRAANLSQQLKEEVHEYIDMKTVYKTKNSEVPSEDGMLSEPEVSTEHDYADLQTVYQTPENEKDIEVDVHMCNMPSRLALSEDRPAETTGLINESELAVNMDESENGDEIKSELDMMLEEIHEYNDMGTVDQRPPGWRNTYLLKSASDSENLTTVDQRPPGWRNTYLFPSASDTENVSTENDVETTACVEIDDNIAQTASTIPEPLKKVWKLKND